MHDALVTSQEGLKINQTLICQYTAFLAFELDQYNCLCLVKNSPNVLQTFNTSLFFPRAQCIKYWHNLIFIKWIQEVVLICKAHISEYTRMNLLRISHPKTSSVNTGTGSALYVGIQRRYEYISFTIFQATGIYIFFVDILTYVT